MMHGDTSAIDAVAAQSCLEKVMDVTVARSRLLIECARTGVDPRTVRKMLAGGRVRPLAAERAAKVIARLNLTPEMLT